MQIQTHSEFYPFEVLVFLSSPSHVRFCRISQRYRANVFSSGEFGYLDQSRSSHQGCCIKNTAHKSFAIFIGKHMLETLFNKATGLQACNFMKKRLEYRCFPVNIAKFLRAPI